VLPHYTLHDLRRSFKTGCGGIGIARDISERCINHSIKGVERTYDRYKYAKEMADAWVRWADHVAGLVRIDVSEAA
jgi:integrase